MKTTEARVFRRWLPAIALGLVFAGLTPALEAEEQRNGGRNCSLRSLHGSYGFYRAGAGPFGTLAGMGMAFFDGEGNIVGVVNNSRGGEISLDEEWFRRYSIEPDCTGSLLGDDGEEIERLVVVDGGKGFYAFNILEGLAVYDVGTRIHDRRGNDDDR